MPVIGRVSNGSSSSRAISYAFGKNQRMKNNTEQWLFDNGVKVDFPYIGYSENSRAVWVGGTNGIDGYHASTDMAFNQKIHNQIEQKNQVKRIVQSFSHDELDPLNPADWEKANKLGVEFAEKAYPEYECAVFTQLDNENHLIHNHIIVDKVNLKTGHKLKEPRRIDDYKKINDELAKKYGMKVIPPKREKTLNAEKIHGRKAYVAYVKETVDEIMLNSEINSKQDFIKALSQKDIIYTDENKMNRFVSKTVKNKSGKPLVVRGKTLGTDYEKEAINRELDARKRDSKIEAQEPKFERTIERTSQIERNYLKSEQDYTESEKRKQQAETDKQSAQSQQSIIAEIVGSFERKANEIRKRLERIRSKIKAKISSQSLVKKEPYTLQFNSKLTGPAEFVTVNPKTKTIGIGYSQSSKIKKIPEKTTILKRNELKDEIARLSDSYHVLNDISMQEKGSLDDIKAFNDELPENATENAILEKPKQPKKPIELDKYGLSRVQRHIIDDGNKILREHGLSDLQMGYDGKTLRENEAEKNHKVVKPLEKKLTKGQIQTVYVANKKYLTAGRPDYMVLNTGLSHKYDLKLQKQRKLAEAKKEAQSKEQTPTRTRRRRTSRRLEIKKNQNQKKNIDRGPKM